MRESCTHRDMACLRFPQQHANCMSSDKPVTQTSALLEHFVLTGSGLGFFPAKGEIPIRICSPCQSKSHRRPVRTCGLHMYDTHKSVSVTMKKSYAVATLTLREQLTRHHDSYHVSY